jgi:hypothetical protein
MNFMRKSATWCIPDETEAEVDELMFSDVIELTGITPVDSVRRIHREHIHAINEFFDGLYWDQDFV